MGQIFESHEEVVAFINALDNTNKKWKIVDNEANEVVAGCESMTDQEQYVWIMENQHLNEDGTASGKYGIQPLDMNNAEMPWLD